MARDQLSATLSALADPTRRAILARLMMGDAPVKDLAAPFDMSIPAICKHLKVLEDAGLVSRGRNAQMRPCRLETAALRDVMSWLEIYRQHWDQSLDRLDGLLGRLQAIDPAGTTSGGAKQ